MTRARATSPTKRAVTQASEALELRAEALDVTVKSLEACQHPESLIYFDRIYGAQCSWEVCDHCGTKHAQVTLAGPAEELSETRYNDRGYNYYASGDDQ